MISSIATGLVSTLVSVCRCWHALMSVLLLVAINLVSVELLLAIVHLILINLVLLVHDAILLLLLILMYMSFLFLFH